MIDQHGAMSAAVSQDLAANVRSESASKQPRFLAGCSTLQLLETNKSAITWAKPLFLKVA
jgi:hypothetical protein